MDRPAPTPALSHRLCEKCRGLCENGAGWCWVPLANGDEYPSVYIHHPSLYVLRATAAEGCALCSMILRTLVEYCCKLDAVDSEETAESADRVAAETEDDIKRIVSRVHEFGILKPAASRHARNPSRHQKTRTHTFHPAFDQEKFERLRSAFGGERVLIKPRTLDSKDAGVKLPSSLSVIWLGSIKTCLSRPADGLERIRFLVNHDDTLAYLSRPGGIRPESSLLSHTHLRRISSWRRICSQAHAGCPGDEEPRELPTRVIAVNSNDPRYVKLVNTHRGRTAVYGCLSYSWGSGTQYRTTTRNIQDHLQRILISDLPETVADAIRLCRALEIPYIWIDSLCIIQDDRDDWSREAGAMASIYGSSVLTISVPDTADCSESFLTRSLDDHSSVTVDWIHGSSGTSGTATLVYDWPRDHSSLLSKSPWMERGWTLQEWVLSPRVLHCGSTMTVFECLHGMCYESHLDATEPPLERLHLESGVSNEPCQSRSLRSPDHAHAWQVDASTAIAREQSSSVEVDTMSRMLARVIRMQHGHLATRGHLPGPSWSEVVVQFCRRKLTRHTDKLPALAGLAVRFQSYKRAMIFKKQQQQTYDYLAGLWWDGGLTTPLHRSSEAAELPAGLLWRRAGDEFLSRPAAYRAPSWSWAALDGPIEFLGVFAPGALQLQIHDALCIYEYPDSLSSVKAGWIDATGLLRRAWPVKSRDHIYLRTGGGEEQDRGESAKERWGVRFDEKVSGPRWREMQRLEMFVLIVATDSSSNSLRVVHHALVLKRMAAEKACQVDCFTRLGTAHQNSVSQDDSARKCEHQENDKGKMFQDWDCKKLRLQ